MYLINKDIVDIGDIIDKDTQFFADDLNIVDETLSDSTKASLVVEGSILISNSTNITGLSSGTFIVLGGSIFKRDVYANLLTTPTLLFTDATGVTMSLNDMTTGTLLATNSVSTGNLYSTNITSTSGVFTSLSTGSLDATGITVSTLLATTNISTGLLQSTNQTTTNGVFTNLSSGQLNITNSITTTNLLATSNISTGLLQSTNQTTTNGVFTNLSAGSLDADSATFGNVHVTGNLHAELHNAIISDEKTLGTNAGTFTSGAWRARDLNTIVTNTGHITIGSNQITLDVAGIYMIDGSCPAVGVAQHKTRFYNITDSGTAIYGTSEDTANSCTRSIFRTKIEINGPKVFEVQHRCTNSTNSYGFGKATGWEKEIYTVVHITHLI